MLARSHLTVAARPTVGCPKDTGSADLGTTAIVAAASQSDYFDTIRASAGLEMRLPHPTMQAHSLAQSPPYLTSRQNHLKMPSTDNSVRYMNTGLLEAGVFRA